jgi:hypothetical protein
MLVVTLVSVVLLEQGTILGREQHLVEPSPPAVRPIPAASKSQSDAATQSLWEVHAPIGSYSLRLDWIQF